MKETQRRGRAGRGAARAALLAPPLALLFACSESDPVGLEGEEFLDEVFHFTVENNVHFGSAVGVGGAAQPLLLDLFQPRTDGGGPRPAILWMHGGGFTEGHKGEMTEYARRFAQRGYVSASVDYRLRPDAVFEYTDPGDPVGEAAKRDAQHDVQAAVRWLRANAAQLHVDPEHIIVAGYSAGGTTALRVALYPDDPGASGNPGHSSRVAAAVVVSGFPQGLREGTVPVLMLHGDRDTKVRYETVEQACGAVSSCELVGIPQADHTGVTSLRDLIIDEAAGFLFDRVVGR
jgi:dienelactone hydrolase